MSSSAKIEIPVYTDVYPGIAASNYDPNTFKGKVVVVTGAGSGIGKETALAFSEMGAKVVFSDWREDACRQAAEEAKKFGNPTLVHRCDVTKLAETEELVNATVKKFGEVDVAVFAAGYGMFDKFAISREKDWWGLIETNLKGPTDFTRLVLPSMIKRNTGKLIYISSRVSFSLEIPVNYKQAGVMDHAFSTAYSISKAGLIRFVGCLQKELEDTDVQAFAVHPGEVGGTQLADVKYVTKDYVQKEAPEVPETIGKLLDSILNCHTRLPAWTSVYLASGKVSNPVP